MSRRSLSLLTTSLVSRFFFFGSPNTVKIFGVLRIDSNHPLEE